MVFSDKLVHWLFQTHPDRILALQPDLPPEASGWRFSAPMVKEREQRLVGLFQPPADQPALPTLLLEAQMGPDPKFLRRLYAQSARLLEQETAVSAAPPLWRRLCGSGCIGWSWSRRPRIPPRRHCRWPWLCWCSRRRRWAPARSRFRRTWQAQARRDRSPL